MPGSRPGATDYARLVTVPAIWGGTFVAGKIVVGSLTPLMGSFARYLVACSRYWSRIRARAGCRGSPDGSGSRPSRSAFDVFAYNLFSGR